MSRQWNASSTFIPKSLLDYVKKMMQVTSHTFLWRGKSIDEPTKYKHTECWNETMNQPDPYCTVCNGSGFIYDYNTGNQKIMRGVIVPNSPHGFHEGAADLHSTVGLFQRIDAFLYVPSNDGRIIDLDDIIVFPFNVSGYNNVEYTVINKIPYHTFNNVPILYRFMLFKQIPNVTESSKTI